MMLAAVFHGAGDIRIEQLPIPEPGAGQVALAPAHNGLCGSDLHEYQMGPLVIPTDPHPLTGAQLPVIMGHEFSGTITAVGDGVTDLRIGDRVAVEPLYHCGTCRPCTSGAYNVCNRIAFHGLMANGGGMSETTVVDATMVHRLPDTVTLEQGALVEPMAVAHHAVRQAGIAEGEPAVVLGAGPIGIGAWFALRAAGAGPIIVVEPSPTRRAAIESLGADIVLDPATADPNAEMRSLTAGEGAAVAIDAAGVPASAMASLAVLRPRGHAVSVAVHGAPVEFDPNILMSEITWTGALAYTSEDFTAVIEAMSHGSYATEGWVEHLSLDEVSTALDRLVKAEAIKILIDVAPDR